MKILKHASGKQTVKMSKKEWQSIGNKSGWTKKAQQTNSQNIPPANTQLASPDALSSTLEAMEQNLMGAYNQLSNLYNTIKEWKEIGLGGADPTGTQAMIDQIISTLESTKKFTPALLQFSKQPQQNVTNVPPAPAPGADPTQQI